MTNVKASDPQTSPSRILPTYSQRGTGLSSAGTPHAPNADKAPKPAPKAKGGPVQRGLGTNKPRTSFATTATNLG
jgi:hypothetical protein